MHGYTHQTVNHTIGFVHERSGAHTNTIDSTWWHVKAFLNPYKRMEDYIYHLAHYVLAAGYGSQNVDQFTKFIGIVASMSWSATPTLDPGNVPSPLVYGRHPQQVRFVTFITNIPL
jgi:hypothetical protein